MVFAAFSTQLRTSLNITGFTLARVTTYASGARSFPTPNRLLRQASRGAVPLPEKGSRTTWPRSENFSTAQRANAGGKDPVLDIMRCSDDPQFFPASFHESTISELRTYCKHSTEESAEPATLFYLLPKPRLKQFHGYLAEYCRSNSWIIRTH
jgi:hypothetical protein